MKNRWRSVTGISVASFVDIGENWTVSTLWPQMHGTLGVSLGQLGPVLGISDLIRTLFAPLWGYATDRYSRKMLLVVFTGFWGLWTLAIGFIDTLAQLYLVRILSAIGLGVFNPAAFSLLGDLFDNKERGRAVGVMTAATILGATAAFFVLPRLAARGPEGWRLGFMVMGAASFVSGLVILALVREPARGAAEPELRDVIALAASMQETSSRNHFARADLRLLAGIPSWRWLMLHEAVYAMGDSIVRGWAFVWLDELGLGLAAATVIAPQTLIGYLGGALLFGWLGDRFEQRQLRRARILVGIVGLLVAVPFAIVYFTLDGSNLPLLVGIGTLMALLRRAAGPSVSWPLAQAVVPPDVRGTARAMMNVARDGVGALVLTVSGLMIEQAGVATTLLILFAGAAALDLLIWLALYRTYGADRAQLHARLAEQRDALLAESAM